MTAKRRSLTEPLESLTGLFGAWMALAVLASAIAFGLGSGSFGGFGNADVCETLPNTFIDDSGVPLGSTVTGRSGASVDMWSSYHACAVDPSVAQRIWYTLDSLPAFLFWACLLWLIWRTLSAAKLQGPFAAPVAIALRRLGWFIIAGSAAAAAVHGLALDALLNSMVRPGPGFADVFSAPVRALLPVPVIAGAAMLTFARIIRQGEAMDAELRATI